MQENVTLQYITENKDIQIVYSDKDIVITGVGNKLEIWSRSKWDEVTGSDAMAKIAAELYDSGDDDSADER